MKVFIYICFMLLMFSCATFNESVVYEVQRAEKYSSEGDKLSFTDYTYNEKGLLIQQKVEYFSPSDIAYFNYGYDELNRLVSVIHLDDEVEVKITEIEYSFDDQNIKIVDNYKFNNSSRERINYFFDNKLFKTSLYKENDSVDSTLIDLEVVDDTYIYSYNNLKRGITTKEEFTIINGNLVKVVYRNKDNEVVNTVELKYTEGVLIEKHEDGAFGKSVTKYFVDKQKSIKNRNYNFLYEYLLFYSKDSSDVFISDN